jgi:heme-degrading monooxygenase HmoA
MSWLRVVTYQLPAGDSGAAVESIKADTATVVALLEEQRGYGGSYWADSPEDNTVSAISYWESLEDIEAAEAALTKIQSMRDSSGPGVSVLEVHNIGLFPVPSISMWSSDDGEDDDGGRHRLLPRRFGRKRH